MNLPSSSQSKSPTTPDGILANEPIRGRSVSSHPRTQHAGMYRPGHLSGQFDPHRIHAMTQDPRTFEPSTFLTNEEVEHMTYEENYLQTTGCTLTKSAECPAEVSTSPPKSKDRRKRRVSISQGIALASPKRASPDAIRSSPTEVTRPNRVSIQTALAAPPLTATPIERLERHVRSGGGTNWVDAQSHLEALRFDFFASEQPAILSKAVVLMCALLHQMNPARKRFLNKGCTNLVYCTELVLTTATFLAVGKGARDQFWDCSQGPVALLQIWTKSHRRTHIEVTGTSFENLGNACAAAFNILTYTEPSDEWKHDAAEEFWQSFMELLESQIHRGVPSDAIQVVDHIYQWEYDLPKRAQESLTEMLPGLAPILWRTLMNDESTDEATVAASIHLLWRAYSSNSGPCDEWSAKQTDTLFTQLSKHPSIRIHEAALGLLQYGMPDLARVRYAEDAVRRIVWLCHSLKTHPTDPAIVFMGLNVLQTLVQVIPLRLLTLRLQTEVASITMQIVQRHDAPSTLSFATRIMATLLEGGMLPHQIVMSFDFLKVARILHGSVDHTKGQEIQDTRPQAPYLSLGALASDPSKKSNQSVGHMISLFIHEICGRLQTEVREEEKIDKFHVLSQLIRTKTLSSGAAETAASIAAHTTMCQRNTRISASCFEILSTLLSMEVDLEIDVPVEVLETAANSLSNEGEPSLPSHAAKFLALLLEKDVTVLHHLSAVPGFWTAVVKCLRRHDDDRTIQIPLCFLLQYQISRTATETVAIEGGIDALVVALRKHGTEMRIAIPACRAIAGLLVTADVDKLYFQREEIAGALLYALRCNIGSAEASLVIIDTQHRLCVLKDFFKEAFIKSIPLVLQCMSVNFSNLAFQQTACSVLRLIASFGESGRLARDMDVLSVLREVVLMHCKCTSLVTEGLRLIAVLASEEKGRSKLIAWSDVLVCLGRVHISDPSVLSEAFAAANNVSLDIFRRTVPIPIGYALFELICLAMKKFPKHAAVQRNACQLLHSHTYNATSLETIRQGTDLVVPLLISASGEFLDCVQCARQIMSHLARRRTYS